MQIEDAAHKGRSCSPPKPSNSSSPEMKILARHQALKPGKTSQESPISCAV